jgi:hypothetical protein
MKAKSCIATQIHFGQDLCKLAQQQLMFDGMSQLAAHELLLK